MTEFILSNIEEYNTFEAYYGNPKIENDYITIPYINMELMKEHPLNYSKEQLFIDFCFLQIIEPKYISVFERGIIKNELDEDYEFNKSKWYGGLFIGDKSILDSEIEVQASSVYLIFQKGFRTSSKMWIPDIKRFKGKGNIAEKEVIDFFLKASKIKKMTI